ncbi:MAG: 3-oxoacyl-ACP reductase FabG [Proteobacteria bacterium]|nr:3-oxoacyl-ACP reductase FabG [Pseudomonadota bacterium]
MKALITGASGGVGRAIAQRLATDGFEVWIHYSANRESAEVMLDEIQGAGGSGRTVTFDVRNIEEIDRSLVPLLSKEGPLDVLVNNAAVSRDGYMMLLPAENWSEVIDVNLNGFFRVTRACLKGMVEKRRGRIVNIGSLAGERGNIGQVAYAASKAGLEGATRSLALEMARWNILVNTVSPGPLDTGMTADSDRDKYIAMIPLGRLGRAEEIAGVVSFLCSEDASYITGQTISVNGGMGM